MQRAHPFVVQRVGLAIRTWWQRAGDPLEQPIREPRIARKHRTVEVRADHVTLDRAIGGIAMFWRSPAQWSRRATGRSHAAMVLEPDEHTGAEHTVLHRDLANESLRRTCRRDVKQTEAFDRATVRVGKISTDDLETGTDGEQRRAGIDRG